ncbi:hypothetical protein IH772_29760 [Escherichia coli]|uniref:Uncharacterized protein n=1 Tax=Escherichia coli TaxID=562 RepID=A0AAP1RCF0_ECOLX|nr:hypothetical protein [Escherichia coli]
MFARLGTGELLAWLCLQAKILSTQARHLHVNETDFFPVSLMESLAFLFAAGMPTGVQQ